MKKKLTVIATLLIVPAIALAQSSRTTFINRVVDGYHIPSKMEFYAGGEPVEIRDIKHVVISDQTVGFPIHIYNAESVILTRVTAPSIILSDVKSGEINVIVGGDGVDIALSLIRSNNLRVYQSRIGKSRIGYQSMPGDAGTFQDTAIRAGVNWNPSRVWSHGTNLAGQGPVTARPSFIGNGTNRVTVPTPDWPSDGWFQFSTPRKLDGVVMVKGLPPGSVRWVENNELELIGGTFEVGKEYLYNTYHPEFLSRGLTIEDSVFDGPTLCSINTFFTDGFLVKNNRFYTKVHDDAAILPEESFDTQIIGNILVPRDPRGQVPAWNSRALGSIGTTVNMTVKGNINLVLTSQHRGRPSYGWVTDQQLNWVGGASPWVD